jgi:hypothetical protein
MLFFDATAAFPLIFVPTAQNFGLQAFMGWLDKGRVMAYKINIWALTLFFAKAG